MPDVTPSDEARVWVDTARPGDHVIFRGNQRFTFDGSRWVESWDDYKYAGGGRHYSERIVGWITNGINPHELFRASNTIANLDNYRE